MAGMLRIYFSSQITISLSTEIQDRKNGQMYDDMFACTVKKQNMILIMCQSQSQLFLWKYKILKKCTDNLIVLLKTN